MFQIAKTSGGTRNYRNNPKVMNTRRTEYNSLIGSGSYDLTRSYFDVSGGFVATHNEHNHIKNHNIDKSDIASINLANKGYKIYLDSEKATIMFNLKEMGIYKLPLDIKTIGEAGSNTIKSVIESAQTTPINCFISQSKM